MTLARLLAVCAAAGAIILGCERRPAPPDVKPGEVLRLTDGTFDAAIAKGVVLVDFWADWCVPCRTQGPIVAEVAAEAGGGVRVARLDIDYAEAKIQRYGLEYLPTLIVFTNGHPFRTFVGLTQKDALLEAVSAAKAAK